MSAQGWVERQEANDESRRLYERERLSAWVLEEIAGLMENKQISKADLARKLEVSRAHMTQLFSGRKNPTLATIADLAWACGLRASVKFEPLRSGEFISAPVKVIPVQNKWISKGVESSQGYPHAAKITELMQCGGIS